MHLISSRSSNISLNAHSKLVNFNNKQWLSLMFDSKLKQFPLKYKISSLVDGNTFFIANRYHPIFNSIQSQNKGSHIKFVQVIKQVVSIVSVGLEL